MKYTIEDLQEYKNNAVEILRRNHQYATASATEKAFDMLMWFTDFNERWHNAMDDRPDIFEYKEIK